MPKVLISDDLSPRAVEIFKERGVDVDMKVGLKPDQLKEIIGDYDGLAIRSATKVTKEILDAALAVVAEDANPEHTKDARISSYSVAEAVAHAVRTSGPAFVVQNTCASANVALSCGADMIRAGICDVAVVGGSEAYSIKNIIGFNSLQAIGPEPCRPFASGRRFVTPSEGAGMLVLQSERSLREGLTPWAELLSVGGWLVW